MNFVQSIPHRHQFITTIVEHRPNNIQCSISTALTEFKNNISIINIIIIITDKEMTLLVITLTEALNKGDRGESSHWNTNDLRSVRLSFCWTQVTDYTTNNKSPVTGNISVQPSVY